MTSTISPVFTGVSSYANDLQNIMSRALQIASMPLTQLQNQLQDMNSRSSALGNLDTIFGNLQTAMQTLSDGVGPGGLKGESSDPTAVSVSVSGAAGADTYTVDVLDPGATSASISSATLPAVADPASESLSASSTFTLTVNGKSFQLTPQDNSLTALMQSINSAGAGVQASIINTGGSGSPDYRLIVRSQNLASDTVQLSDGANNLLDALNTGKPAQYEINGIATPILSNSRTVTLAPGISATLLDQTPPGQPVTITVSRDQSSLETALSGFVSAYNAAVDAVDQQIGKNAGPLMGQDVIYTVRSALSQITQYTQDGPIASLAEIGVNLDRYGKLSLDAAKFSAADPASVQAFLGGVDTTGFLHSVSQVMAGIEDPLQGALPSASKLQADEIAQQNSLISDKQRQIADLQTSLQEQMSSADALLANLENQKNYFNNLFTAMTNYNLNGAGVKAS